MAEDAFTLAYRAYRTEIDGWFLRKTRDPALSEELTQETFARLAARLRESDAVLLKRPYLYRIAHNLLVDHLRRSDAPQGTGHQDIETLCDEAPSPEAAISAQQEVTLMKAALMQLSPRTREIFVLVRLDGQSYRQVAQALGVSESSIQKHLAVAVAHLAQKLRGR